MAALSDRAAHRPTGVRGAAPAGEVATSHDFTPYLSDASFWSPYFVDTSAWLQHAPFAFWVTSILKPRSIVELGTHFGFSYFSFCQSVQANGLDTRCFAVDTWKGDIHAGEYGLHDDAVFEGVNTYNNAHYSPFSTLVRSTFDDALPYFEDSTVDLLHVDGRHFYNDVKHDFESWEVKLSDSAVVLFHDTNVRERGFGVSKFWAELANRFPHFEFFHGHGLGVLGYGAHIPDAIRPLFAASADQTIATGIRNAYSRLGRAVQLDFEGRAAQSRLTQSETAAVAPFKTEAESQLGSLRGALEARDQEIAGLRQTLDSANGQGAHLRAELEVHSREAERLKAALHARGGEVTALGRKVDEVAAKLNAKDREIAQLSRELARRQKDFTSIQRQFDQHYSKLGDRHAGALERTKKIEANLVASREREIALNNLLTTRDHEAAQRDAKLASQETDNIGLRRELETLRTQLADLQGKTARLGVGSINPPTPEEDRHQPLPITEPRPGPDTEDSGPSDSHSALRASASKDKVGAAALVGRPLATVDITKLPGLDGLDRSAAERVFSYFDAAYYLAKYPDVEATGIIAFEHFMTIGWREDRDPCGEFSTSYYLKHSPDIAKAGINPFVHWVLHGIGERRSALSLRDRVLRTGYAPKVSVIVPNFNHARYLRQRIDSILGQSYSNFDVLLLDDCSTDDSRDVIADYCARFPGRVRALFNTDNSGNVFRQWRKGIDNSDGEIVWICESDDFCEPTFLERLVGYFLDESVMLAFGRIQDVDQDGNILGLDGYRERAEPGIWGDSLVRPARLWFANALGVRNVIANVGGSLWRRTRIPEAVWREAQTYTVVGDWYLYLNVAGGGQIAWDPEAVSYFRRHTSSTSGAFIYTPSFYQELERFMIGLRRQWDVPDRTVEMFYKEAAEIYSFWLKLDDKLGSLAKYCNTRSILTQRRVRPHILIAFYGFIFGGGEVFPVNLANELHANGWLVSMLVFETGGTHPDMRAMLNPAIPVYDSAWVSEYGGGDRFLADAGINLIHSHTLGAELWFFEYWSIKSKIPYIATLHGSYEATNRAHLPDDRIERLASGVKHFVYTAEKNLKPFEHLKLPFSILTKLPNAMPIDPLPFPKSREDLQIAPDAIVFTLVARGIPEKGWEPAVKAFIRLREAYPKRPMHLLLCGAGDEPDRLEALHGADPDITFLGFQARIHGLYRISDVAIVPSRFSGESFPLCIIQSVQTGTPVIGTRVGEIETMLSAPDMMPAGIVIDPCPDDKMFVQSLVGAMESMLSPERRESYAAGARKCAETYSMERLVKVYGSIYRSLLADSKLAANESDDGTVNGFLPSRRDEHVVQPGS